MTPDQILAAMRIISPNLTNTNCFQIGIFDQKVTIHAQQVRAYNLAWALRESGVIQESTRIAVIGGGAAGLTTAAALYKSSKFITIFERGEQWMRLQRENTTRYLHPDIYDWPRPDGKLDNRTFDLPDLDWSPGLARDVVREIEDNFKKYENSFILKQRTTVKKIATAAEQGIAVTSICDDITDTKCFDVVILAIGFGLEREYPDFDPVSYWSNDDFASAIREQDKPDLVIGTGDGGLTDAIRLGLFGFEHKLIEDFARLPDMLVLGEKLRKLEPTVVSAEDYNCLYEQCTSMGHSGEILAEFRRLIRKRSRPVHITARNNLLYGPHASRLNKLIVRHLVEMKAIAWQDFSALTVKSKKSTDSDTWVEQEQPIYKSDLKELYNRIIFRAGPAGILKDIIDNVVIPGPAVVGYNLGTTPFFKFNGFFLRPEELKRQTILSLCVGDANSTGGGCAGELREVKQRVEKSFRPPPIFKNKTFDPSLWRYIRNTYSIEKTIAHENPDLVLVMGSDFAPILTEGQMNKYKKILNPLRVLSFSLKRPKSIMEHAENRPVIYFGAAKVDEDDLALHRNLHVLYQDVNDENIIDLIQQGFPDSVVSFLAYPFRYPLDHYFWSGIRDAYSRMKSHSASQVTFILRRKFVFLRGASSVALLKLGWKRHRGKNDQHIFIGRMTTHMLASNHFLMNNVPCLSSYNEDVERGAIISYDNNDDACAREIYEDFIKPLLRGRSPSPGPRKIGERNVRGSRLNAERFKIRVHSRLLGDIRGW